MPDHTTIQMPRSPNLMFVRKTGPSSVYTEGSAGAICDENGQLSLLPNQAMANIILWRS